MGRFHSAVNFNIKTLIYALYLTFFPFDERERMFQSYRCVRTRDGYYLRSSDFVWLADYPNSLDFMLDPE